MLDREKTGKVLSSSYPSWSTDASSRGKKGKEKTSACLKKRKSLLWGYELDAQLA